MTPCYSSFCQAKSYAGAVPLYPPPRRNATLAARTAYASEAVQDEGQQGGVTAADLMHKTRLAEVRAMHEQRRDLMIALTVPSVSPVLGARCACTCV